MSQARGAQEPTMEEILSSIRRIISEDGKRTGEENAEPSVPEPAPVVPLRAMPPAGPPPETDDVLELTEIAPEEPGEPEPLELVEEAAAPTLAEPAFPSKPQSQSRPQAQPEAVAPLPKMEPVPVAEPVPPPAPVPPARAALTPVSEPELEPEPPSPPKFEPEPEPEPIEDQAEPEPEPEPELENNLEPLEISVSPSDPDIQPRSMARSRLMSEATEIASSAALSVLAQVVQPGRGFTEEGRRMMDQIMRERLEEHLRNWVDTNLPGLVERIVREEIAGLVERSIGRRS
jgi:cell pole-organizing protein PopZ